MTQAIEAKRRAAVEEAIGEIRAIEESEGVSRSSLERIRDVLTGLAAREELFPAEEFPPPPPDDAERSTRYLLHEDPDQRFALYLNSLNPGKSTNPHDHTTWAVVVAIEGQELNRVYDRVDGGSGGGKARLELAREVVVEPGRGICLMPEDIHSIHVTGERPTRHLHMYGRSLETLTERVGYDLDTGRVVKYNERYMSPTVR